MKFTPKPLERLGILLVFVGFIANLSGLYMHFYPQVEMSNFENFLLEYFFAYFAMVLYICGVVAYNVSNCFKEK